MATVTIGEKTGATFTGCQDTQVRQQAATTNYATTTPLEVHKYASGDHAHLLIKFPGLSNIPVGATITAATLYIALSAAVGDVSYTITARRLLRDWVVNQRAMSPRDGAARSL